MAWVESLLVDYPGPIDPAWLQPPLTVAEFLEPFVRNAKIHVQPKVRAEYEAAIAADRKRLEGAMQPGDVVRPWCDSNSWPRGVGLAVFRGERLVRAWATARLV